MHKVPNARFLELKPQALVRVFFPGLMEALQPSVCVPEDRLREFYDDGVHPAAIQVLPEELHRGFASSYDDDKFKADTSKPGKQGRLLQQLAQYIHVDDLNAGNVEDGDHPRIIAVDAILKDFNTHLFEDGHWFLDIVTTISV
ncbi:hypothetical protein FRC07_007269 [Ceratobasidium sp. 392]|nr:hypothetical protein FRC07_007269 [Ceratobasidium sp. 392]